MVHFHYGQFLVKYKLIQIYREGVFEGLGYFVGTKEKNFELTIFI